MIKRLWQKKKNNSGFSLLEIVFVLGIISVGLLGVSSLVFQSSQAKSINQNYLIASMLAQEGLELVRNIRDENWLLGRDWKLGTVGEDGDFYDIVQDHYYVIDYGNGSATTIKDKANDVDSLSDSGARLYRNATGFYTHTSTGNTSTPFFRLISVSETADKIVVSSEVQWRDSQKLQSYKAETELYDWR